VRRNNHKVVRIEYLSERDDTYNITVEEDHNFVTSAGVVVKNSQAELRVGCSIANERHMIGAYNKGADIHRLTASILLHKPLSEVTKEERQMAKAVNFGFLYGQEPEGFKIYAEDIYGLRLSIRECTKFRAGFFEQYSDFLMWYERVKISLRTYGYIEYPTGWRCRFPSAKGRSEVDDDVKNKAINYPVQGSSAQILFYTMIRLSEFINKNALDALFIGTVHDSLGLDCAFDLQQTFITETNRICREDIPVMFPWLRVPMLFDYAVGETWGDVVEVNNT
jgi:DNA polymerase I-like protein with 3'-5' exonuclease and polymerase domains